MELVCFIISILFICIAHLIRIVRWKLFIDIYEKSDNRSLFRALSVGYMINYFVPFKLGDIVRAWIAGKSMRNGKALGLSTVIVDRYLDIVSVGIIFVILCIGQSDGVDVRQTAYFYVFMMFFLLILAFAVYAFRGHIKKIIKAVAGIFASRIEIVILSFAWALIWNFKDIFQKINKLKLIVTTIGMWFFYLVSYFFFGEYLSYSEAEMNWINVFVMLFTQNGIKKSTGTATLSMKARPASMIVYIIFPIFLFLVLSFFCRKPVAEETENSECLNLFPHLDSVERLKFLENYFSNMNREYVANYLKINREISIIRDYSAGSNATTMLCVDFEKTFFRKYAFGDDGEKLYEQILWLKKNRDKIALPEIIRQEKTNLYCYYDMSHHGNSVGLFEYIHSMPVIQGWEVIRKTLESLEKSIYRMDARPADRETIHRYIEVKATKNLKKIKSAKRIRNLQQYETVYINGVEYSNLSAYEKFLSEEYLQKVFQNDIYAVIHGDLTIENIICTRDDTGKDDFYMIDPNTGNIHDSPNLDYGKLLQSVHGGYEFLMSTKSVSVSENKINFIFAKSSVYSEIHKLLHHYMQNNLGYERTKSIYYHEIIHWLRLMPYKIEKDDKRAMIFYAGMLIVMNDVVKMYGND